MKMNEIINNNKKRNDLKDIEKENCKHARCIQWISIYFMVHFINWYHAWTSTTKQHYAPLERISVPVVVVIISQISSNVEDILE